MIKKWRRLLAVSLILGSLLFSGCGKSDRGQFREEQDTRICGQQVEYRVNPIGIDEERPYFSWRMESNVRGQKQTAYRLTVASTQEALKEGSFLWDSGKQESDISVAIPYEGDALDAASRYYWTVQVWDKEGQLLESEEVSYFETGLMDSGWSGARWLSAPQNAELEEFEPEVCRYSVSYKAFAGEAAAGFIFGADTDAYGEYYVWMLTGGEEAVLRTFRMDMCVMKSRQYHLQVSSRQNSWQMEFW